MEWQTEGAAAPEGQLKEEGSPYDHLIEVFLLYQCRVCQYSSVESKNSILSHIRTKHCKEDGTLQEVELFSASISVFGENFANTLSGGARPHTSDGHRNSSGREAVNLGSSPGRFITKATVKAVREVIDTSSLKSAKSQKTAEREAEDTFRFLGNSDDEEVSDLGKDKDPDYRPSGVRRTVAKRVRRSKVADPEEAEKAEDDGNEKELERPGVRTRRGRGRPRKVKVRLQEGVKRKRGRPRKVKPAKVQKPKFVCRVESCSYRPMTQETLELHEKCHMTGAADFRCFLCDHVTSRWSAMHVHINYSHKNMYYCQECEYSTRALPFLKRHMADKHLHSALCEQCGRSFPSSSYLALHVIEEHSDKSKHKCPQCHFTTPYDHELQQHLTCHLPQFTCKVCGEKFSAKMELAGHIQILHPGEKIFFCDFCSYTAKLKHHLENHMNSQHTARGVFPCPDCGKVYKTQHHMEDHRQRQHKKKQDKAYPCHYCDFISTSLQGIHLHEKQRHTQPTPTLRIYNCEHCDKSFPTKSKRTTHIKQTHLRSYKCPHCEFSSGDKAHLRSHLIKHLSKDPDDAVKCPHCKQVFLGKEAVRAHVKDIHPGQPVTFCKECNFTTKHKGSLWKHRDSVHSGKIFMCSHCGKKLKTLDCVRTHERNHCPVIHEGRRQRVVYLPRASGEGSAGTERPTEQPAAQTPDTRAEPTNTPTATTAGTIFTQDTLVATSGGGASENTPLPAHRQGDKVPDGSEAPLLRQESVVMRAGSPEGSEARQTDYTVMRPENEALLLRQDVPPPRSVSVPYTRTNDLQRPDVPLTMTFMRPENLLADRRSEFTDEPGRTFPSAYDRQEAGNHGDGRLGGAALDPLGFERDHFAAHVYRRDFLQTQREMFERSGVNAPGAATLMTLVEPAGVPVNLAQDRQSQDRPPGGAAGRAQFPALTAQHGTPRGKPPRFPHTHL
ncbi:hypothetical protein Bbelb_383360 [Branchiostoma belcheri]|nr:hypothetical protein Bbelb_383360 [Branchiostoma belcheri]